MNKKQKILLGILIPIFIFMNIVGYQVILIEKRNSEEKTYCGTVINSGLKETAVRHGSVTDFYVAVDFDGVGKIAVETDATTYYTSSVGSRICLILNKRQIGQREHYTIFQGIMLMFAGTSDIILIGWAFVELWDRGRDWYMTPDIKPKKY